MKSNYFLRWTRQILCMLALLVGVTTTAQSFIVGFPSHATAPTQNPRNVIVANGSSLLKVRLDVAAASTSGANVTIQLPTGVEYVTGSVAKINGTAALTIVDNGGGANAPNFRIGPNALAVGQFIEFTIARRATCAAQVAALGGAVFNDVVTGTITGATPATATTSAYQVTYPVLSMVQPATLTNAVLGQAATRTFTINNGGNGSANALYLTITYPANSVQQTGLQITGGSGSTGTAVTLTPTTTTGTVATSITHNYTITAAQLSGGGLDFGEALTFTESYIVKGCGATTNYSAGYGTAAAAANWCQTVTGTGSVSMATGAPSYSNMTVTNLNFVNMCTPWDVRVRMTNGGTGGAKAAGMYNVMGVFGMGWYNTETNLINQTQYTISNVRIGTATATYNITGSALNGTMYIDMSQFTTDPDGAGVGLDDLDGDGFYDDLPAGQYLDIIYTYQFKCNAAAACGANIAYHGPVARMEYDNMCGTHFTPNPQKDINVSPQSGTGNYFGQGAVSPTTTFPPQITGSVNPGDQSFDITFSAPIGSSSLPINGTGMFIWEVTIPAGVSIVGTPQIVHPSTFALSPATYTQTGQVVRFQVPYFFTMTSPTLRNLQVKFEYLCGAGGNLTFNQKLYRYNDYANDCKCFGELFCNNFNILAICPSPCPAGPTAFQPEVRRTNASLGYADYNLTTQRTAAELSPTSLKTALYKHQIQITGRAKQNNTTNNMHVELELNKTTVGSLDKLKPISAVVKVTRGGSVITTTTLTTFTTTASTATKTVMDLDLTSCFPTGVLAGDEVEVVAIYEVATNTGLPTTRDLAPGAKWRFYNTNTSGGKDFCLDWTPEMYLVGTTLANSYVNQIVNATGCTTFAVHTNPRRLHSTGDTYFPSEIIPFAYWNSIEVTIPDGYEFVSMTNLASSQPGISLSSPQYTYTNPTIVGKVYTFTNDGSWPIPRIAHGVEYNDQRTILNLRPTCASNTTTPVVNFKNSIKDFYYAEVAGPRGTVPPTGAFEVANIPYTGTQNTSINYNTASKPTITITNQSGTVQAARPSESFVVRMASTGTSAAPYTWLAIPNVTGVVITEVRDVATNTVVAPLTYTGGLWYKLTLAAGLASGTYKDYRVSFTYTTCDPTDVNVIGGWNCDSYPTNPDEYTCGPATVNTPFHIVPQQAEVQINPVTMPTGINLCSPMQYEYRINSAGAGNTINNTFDIKVPVGASVVAGTVQAEYPVGSGNWQAVSVTTVGDTTTADLTTYVNYPAAGLPGTLTDGGNSASRLMGIRFQVNTDCDFVVNSRIFVSTKANRSCGAPATGDGTGGPSINVGVAGVVPGVILVPQFNAPAPLNNCSMAPVAFNNIRLRIQTPPTAGATGIVRVLLPEGFNYVPNSFGCSSVKCATFSSVITTGDGKRYIELNLPTGLVINDELVFNLSMVPTGSIACGTHEVTLTTFDRIAGVTCPSAPSGVCPGILAETGTATTNITVNKPQLEIQSVSYTRAIPACGTAAAVASKLQLSVKNSGTVNQTNSSPANPVVVHIYAADGTGAPTGAILATYTMTGPIAAGATVTETANGLLNTATTNLVAVISETANCVCSTNRLAIDIAPIATCDTATYTKGTPVTVNVLANDTTGDTVVPTTVSLVASSITGATCTVTDADGDCTSVNVPGEGVWTVNPTTGAVTFTPATGFTGTPKPIQYNVEDAEGTRSNNAWITIDLMPVATNDTACMTTGSPSITVSVLTNDTTGDVIVPSRVSLVALPAAIGIITDAQGDITQMTVPAQGVWSVNASGQVIFTPSAGFTGNPTPIQYNGRDAEGNVSNNATVTISTVATPVSGGNQTVCAASPVQTLTASATVPAGQSIVWYTAATGGTVVASPTLSTIGTVTYYAQGVNGTCTSATRTAVTLTIQPLVSITITPASPGTVCVGGTTILTASPAGGTWTSNSPNAVITQNNANGTAFVTINGTGDFTFNYAHPGVTGVSCANSTNNVTLVTGVAIPQTPVISTTPATCSAAGTATITNYVAANTYAFTPAGPTVGAGGVINGMTAGTTYTVTATTPVGSCKSVASASFSISAMLAAPAAPAVATTAATCSAAGTATITNYVAANTYTFTPAGPTVGAGGVITGMTAGTSYTVTTTNVSNCTSAASASFSISAMLATPATPVVTTTASTCAVAGTATITNYVAANTYTFTPAGPTVGAGGVISGMTVGTSYTVTSRNASNCTSAASASFSISATLDTPATPVVTTAAATCAAAGTATITNYVAANTYTFTPAGPTVGAGGVISGMTVGTSYTVTSRNASNCTSGASASFSVSAMLVTPATALISTTPATCSAAGTATITNYVAANTYTFAPTGPTVGAGGVITGMTAGTTYTVTVSNASGCSSSVSESFSVQAQLATPTTPAVTTTPATCSAAGTATITNYVAANTYTFTPAGPTVSAGGVISNMTAGTTYTVTASNASGCVSTPSASFSVSAMLATPARPVISTIPATCSSAGIATITNYVAANTYTFTPAGPTVGAGGVITGMTAGTTYRVTASNAANCASPISAQFSVQAMLPTPAVPTVSAVTQPSCSVVNGSFTITNYLASNTYSITSPTGSVISGPTASGLITASAGTYTITASANGCTSAPVVVVVEPQKCADIVTVKTNNQTMYVAGKPITYTITVKNNGPTAATNVNVVDNAPAGTMFTSWTSSNGTGTGNINDVIANLAVGQTVTYTVNVDVPASMLGNLVNTVTVTSDTPDPEPTCTTCTDTDTPNTTFAENDINNTFVNKPVSGNVLTNDYDPQGHTQTVTPSTTTTPQGTLVLNANGTYTFTPATGFEGTFVHTYTVCDNATPQACDTATLTIEVMPSPNVPGTPNDVVANNDTATTPAGQPVIIDILANDFDPNGDTLGTPTVVTPPTNGTFNPVTGVYTPAPGFVGVDTFTYQVCDNGTPQACDTAVVTINVVPVNTTNETYANDDAYNGNQYQPINGSVLDNDTDPEGNRQTVSSNTQPQNGTVVMNPDGTFVYTPTGEYSGPDKFTYTVCDNGTPQACDTATVYLTVNPNNTTKAVNDINNTFVNKPVSGNVLTNDYDPQGHTQTVTPSTTTTPQGTLLLNANGTYTFTPATGFVGTFVHTYTVCDNGTPRACDTATLTIEVMPNPFSAPNDVVANNDTATTPAGQPVIIDILANDFDPNGDTLGTPTVVTPPAHGTFDPVTGVYTPTPGFVGVDTFTYQVCDNGTPQACDTAVVTINVVPVNTTNETYANDDAYNGNDPTITGNVIDNDTDPEGNTQIVTSNTQPQHGTLVVNLDGTFVYTPTLGYTGPDKFTYTICDNGTPQACDTATVYLTVNSAPAIVITKDGTYVDSNNNGVANVGDVINYVFTVKNTGNVILTNVKVTDANAVVTGGPLPTLAIGATDTTTFKATHVLTQADIDAGFVYNLATASGKDPNGDTVEDESTDPTPCTTCPVDPTCTDCTIVEIEQEPSIEIQKEGTYVDTNGDGRASVGDVINYVFTVKNTGNVTLTNVTVTDNNAVVTGGPLAVLAVGLTDATTFKATHVLTQADIDAGYVYNLAIATGTPPSGPNVTDESSDPTPCTTCPVDPACTDCTIVEIEQEPSIEITKDGTYVDTNGDGRASVGDFINYVFTVENTGNVTLTNVTVTDANAVVTGGPIPTLAVGALDTTTFTATHVLTQADIDAGYVYNLAIATGTPPSGPNVIGESTDPTPCATCPVDPVCTDCTIVEIEQEPAIVITKDGTYVDADGNGVASVGDVINYVFTVENTGNVTLTNVTVTDANAVVTGGPLATLAVGALDTTTFTATHVLTQADIDAGYVYNLAIARGTDPNGDPVTGESTDPTPCATCPVDPTCTDCTIVEIPNFTHAIDDINNTFVNTPVSGNVLNNDFDLEGDKQTVTVNTNPANGTVTINAEGIYTYTPNANFTGVDSFTYTICDDGKPQACDTATVTINIEPSITPTDNTVVANNDAVITEGGVSITIPVLANDFDPQGDPFTITPGSVTTPANGTVTVNPDGTITYTPNPGFIGEDTFTYTICDNGNPEACDTATVIVTVLPESNTNRTFAIDDAYFINCSSVANLNLLDNDYDLEGDQQTINTTPIVQPLHGTVTINPDGTFTYTVNGCYVGPDSFVYEVCDNGSPQACDRATVYLLIKDTTAPTFVEALPEDQTVECDAVPAADVLTAVDNCGTATVAFKEVRKEGSCANSYTLERTWTATDECGNTTVHTQIITVEDTTGPTFVGPMPEAEIFIRCEDFKPAETLTATDKCGEATVRVFDEKVEGECESKYDIVRTWIATDSCGNETTYTQIIHLSCPMEVFNAVTPNGDGMNDEFILKGIECYPGNSVQIYNRWGVLVFETKNYNSRGNTFKGYSEGRVTVNKNSKLPSGTYYYVVKYTYDLGNGNQYPTEQAGYLHLENN